MLINSCQTKIDSENMINVDVYSNTKQKKIGVTTKTMNEEKQTNLTSSCDILETMEDSKSQNSESSENSLNFKEDIEQQNIRFEKFNGFFKEKFGSQGRLFNNFLLENRNKKNNFQNFNAPIQENFNFQKTHISQNLPNLPTKTTEKITISDIISNSLEPDNCESSIFVDHQMPDVKFSNIECNLNAPLKNPFNFYKNIPYKSTSPVFFKSEIPFESFKRNSECLSQTNTIPDRTKRFHIDNLCGMTNSIPYNNEQCHSSTFIFQNDINTQKRSNRYEPKICQPQYENYLVQQDFRSQSNNLFNHSFPINQFFNKKRSYSEADMTKINRVNPFLNNRDYINNENEPFRKINRTSSEACIDPRIFYKNVYSNTNTNIKENISKPAFSYAQIITRAINSSATGSLSLGEIYKWIEDNFEYYRHANPVWKNSIRHNLSLSKCFKKVPREPGTRGKGGKWTVDKDYIIQEENRKKGYRLEDTENEVNYSDNCIKENDKKYC